MSNFGLEPDPWQVEVLEGHYDQLLLNCCRQAGKSTVVAMLALAEAVFKPFSMALLLSRCHRQSMELFKKVTLYYHRLGAPMKQRLTTEELELDNMSRIVCLPCKEETIRGYSGVTLLIIDEASRVPDDLYGAVQPMLATSGGRMILLSTPRGKRGFFFEAWSRGGDDWRRIEIPIDRAPRVRQEIAEKGRRMLGESWYRQEYCCAFEAVEGLVYPHFERCLVPALPAHISAPAAVTGLTRVGGLDFGYRNPFAAIWGVLDRDGVLWLTGEHYGRERILDFHAEHLPRDVMWYADPSGAEEIAKLVSAGFRVRRGNNELFAGVGAVRARVENGTLKVLEGACPNLLGEAGLYSYEEGAEARRCERPVDEHNHALGALRYLISRLDYRQMALLSRRRKGELPDGETPPGATAPPPKPKEYRWLRYDNEELWTPLE
jgi:hypothetical protein